MNESLSVSLFSYGTRKEICKNACHKQMQENVTFIMKTIIVFSHPLMLNLIKKGSASSSKRRYFSLQLPF